ncbi:MAG TPA: hypothetical protein VEN95_06795, partial [Actinomycetota bacterium]|nr:hypothetical protein [Actinomycetota bacterium]
MVVQVVLAVPIGSDPLRRPPLDVEMQLVRQVGSPGVDQELESSAQKATELVIRPWGLRGSLDVRHVLGGGQPVGPDEQAAAAFPDELDDLRVGDDLHLSRVLSSADTVNPQLCPEAIEES